MFMPFSMSVYFRKLSWSFFFRFVFFIKFKQSSNTLVGAVAGATEQFGWDIWKNQRVAEGLWEESALGQWGMTASLSFLLMKTSLSALETG